MEGLRGSFLGFTYNGIHSSTLGITRTSSGSRYNESLVPSMTDRAADKLGVDGQFFYGTTYNKREFTINYAVEGMTAAQKSMMDKYWLDKKPHLLIFDESPYKVYCAKITGTAQLKFLPFTQNKELVYRGEGSFVFRCAFPYGRSRFEYQEDYVPANISEWAQVIGQEDADTSDTQPYATLYYDFDEVELAEEATTSLMSPDDFLWIHDPSKVGTSDTELGRAPWAQLWFNLDYSKFCNYSEWYEASLIPSKELYGSFTNGEYRLFNAGDVPAPFRLWFLAKIDSSQSVSFEISNGDNKLVIKNLSATNNKVWYYVVDCQAGLIQAYDDARQPLPIAYNAFIAEGDFFYLPTGEQTLKVTGATPKELEFHYWYL